MTSQPRVCRDCQELADVAGLGRLDPRRARPAPHPGPRCATHWRTERKRRGQVRRDAHRVDRYGITPEEYGKLYEAQGRRCAICRRATGASKSLAVDHDHSCCPGPTSCGGCVRGLLCGPCNSMVAHARDDAVMFRRAIRYLAEWPSRTAGI